MPNDVSNAFHSFLDTVKADLSGFVAALTPSLESLSETALSQIVQAAETFVSSGGNYVEALGVLMVALASDLAGLESAVSAVFASQVAKLQASAAAATATPSAGSTPAS